jgi:hypothetical protein
MKNVYSAVRTGSLNKAVWASAVGLMSLLQGAFTAKATCYKGVQFHEHVEGEKNSILSVNKQMMETENAWFVKEAFVTYSLLERR